MRRPSSTNRHLRLDIPVDITKYPAPMPCRLSETTEPPELVAVPGRIVPGHQAASGTGRACPYPGGTIRAQMPHFLARGLDLSECRAGTLNVDLTPRRFRLRAADWTFRSVAWTDRIPPEDFSFSRCVLEASGKRSPAWIYYPHPETKAEHFQSPTLVEVIAPDIAGLAYGDPCVLHVQPEHWDGNPA